MAAFELRGQVPLVFAVVANVAGQQLADRLGVGRSHQHRRLHIPGGFVLPGYPIERLNPAVVVKGLDETGDGIGGAESGNDRAVRRIRFRLCV